MINYYRNLLYDEVRIKEFQKAISTLVNETSTVAEIGFGLGTYSFFCAQRNARSVYAIERADVFDIGKELARRNNLDSKITFIKGNSNNIKLPEKVDYIIMEDYTPIFASDGLFKIISDARQRFLKPGGKFIPNTFELKFALVEYPDFHNFLRAPNWKNNRAFGINWEYTTELLFNHIHSATRPGIKLLSDEYLLTTIDLTTSNDFSFQFSDSVKVQTPGTIHGIIGWWDCRFTPEQHFSNSPLAPANTWGQMYFPIRYPIAVEKGAVIDTIFKSIHSKYTDTVDYYWKISGNKAEQEYNTFISKVGSKDFSKKINPNDAAIISKSGKINRFILNCIDGKRSYNDIANQVIKEFPEEFTNQQEALIKILSVIDENL